MGDLYQDPLCTECNNRHSNIDYCPPWSPPAPPTGTGWSRCDSCKAVFPSAPFGHVHKCQCSGGMMKPIPAGGDIRPPNCRNWLEDNGKAHPKSGCQVEGCKGALGPCLAVNPPQPSGTGSYMDMGIIYRCVDCRQYHVPDTPCVEADDEAMSIVTRADTTRTYFHRIADGKIIGLYDAPAPKREHHHTELIKRAIIRAHVQMTKGLGMSQAARLATDEIVTLFVDDHRCMEPYCNCPVGLADDAYDPGGPLSGYPRPLCLIHNPDPKGRR